MSKIDYSKLHKTIKDMGLTSFYTDVMLNNNSKYLPYHNNVHQETVAALALSGCEYYNIPESIKKCVISACLIHDFNHSGGKLKNDRENVDAALNALVDIATKYDSIFTSDDVKIMYSIINSTVYPYVVETEHLPLYTKIVLDSDILQSFLIEPYSMIVRGLSDEMNVSYTDLLNGQVKFIDSYKPHTEWGQTIYDSRVEIIKETINNLK